uniref:Uncharacterized protein n=1 Tax=Talaromyces marneffei PM1 TaxID=1077442 RepID=A0A093UL90_TALMA
MDLSPVQDLPHHLARRSDLSGAPVYDLKFDYDFRRVPRTYGDSQMRIDFSNEEGYWDAVVDRPGQTKKKKRDLEEMVWQRCHRWLANLVGVGQAEATVELNHHVDETLQIILMDEQYGPCPFGVTQVSATPRKANIRATLEANVQVDTSFGITIIVTLGSPLDLSNSYLYFKNKGKINLADHENSRIGVVTIGPNMAVYASADASVTLSRIFNFYNWGGTAQVPIASVPHKQITPNTCVGSNSTLSKRASAGDKDMTLSWAGTFFFAYYPPCNADDLSGWYIPKGAQLNLCDPTIAKFNKDNGAATAGSVPIRHSNTDTGGFDFPLDAQDTSPSNFLANTATKGSAYAAAAPGTLLSWPARPAGVTSWGLQTAWCFWIDNHLAKSEANVGPWLNTGKIRLQQFTSRSSQLASRFISTYISPNGLASTAWMHFPQADNFRTTPLPGTAGSVITTNSRYGPLGV